MKTAIAFVMAALAVAAVSADHETCDDLTRIKIQGQWRRAYSTGSDREHFAQALYRAILAQSPEIKALLKDVGSDDTSSPKFKAHAARQLGKLNGIISLLDQPEALKAAVTYLHNKLAAKNIPDSYIDVYRRALAHVLPAQLGRSYDKEAWKACWEVLAQALKAH
jgi:hemoglobin-like flavoprotein